MCMVQAAETSADERAGHLGFRETRGLGETSNRLHVVEVEPDVELAVRHATERQLVRVRVALEQDGPARRVGRAAHEVCDVA